MSSELCIFLSQHLQVLGTFPEPFRWNMEWFTYQNLPTHNKEYDLTIRIVVGSEMGIFLALELL